MKDRIAIEERKTVQKKQWVWIFGLLCMLLQGCTPDYNWRELSVAEERATIAFPARVQTEQRPLKFDDLDLAFSLTTSSVGPAVFAVGYTALPGTMGLEKVTALKEAVVASLFARSGQPVTPAALSGEAFELEMTVSGQASWMMARVVVHRGMLIQVVASGPKNALPKEQAIEFMRSLVLK